jgi:hypothetical protein
MTADDWKQTGNIYLWRYKDNPKNLPGHHLTADHEGIESVSMLIQMLLQSSTETKRTLRLTAPKDTESAVPDPRSKKKIESVEKLVLQFEAQNDSFWSLTGDKNKLMLRAGRTKLLKLREGLKDIEKGRGDYYIGPKGQELWFWWRTTV